VTSLSLSSLYLSLSLSLPSHPPVNFLSYGSVVTCIPKLLIVATNSGD
jgi:hypothetical protein